MLRLRPLSDVAIVMWASSNGDLLNRILTNGDLLKLMPVSRSVYTSLAKVEARAFAEFESTHAESELEEAMLLSVRKGHHIQRRGIQIEVFLSDVELRGSSKIIPHQCPATTAERMRRICWGEFFQERKKTMPQGKSVKVTLKTTSGKIWIETEPLPVLCTLARIVFDVAGIDRRDTVVPYLIYDTKVQPYWKSLMDFLSVRNGSPALEMTVVLQPKETCIATVFETLKDEAFKDMSFETFRNCVQDPKDELYMDIERLMNHIFPVNTANLEDIWLAHGCLSPTEAESFSTDDIINTDLPSLNFPPGAKNVDPKELLSLSDLRVQPFQK